MEAGAIPEALDNSSCLKRPLIEWPSLMRTGGTDGVHGAVPLQQNSGYTNHIHTFGKVIMILSSSFIPRFLLFNGSLDPLLFIFLSLRTLPALVNCDRTTIHLRQLPGTLRTMEHEPQEGECSGPTQV
jgi:hypothetical protein